MNYLSNKYRNCGMVSGAGISGVLGGTGDPGQPGSQLGVPIHHLALSDHDHDLAAAMVFHIGDERLVRQRSDSRVMDSGRMNGAGTAGCAEATPDTNPGVNAAPTATAPNVPCCRNLRRD